MIASVEPTTPSAAHADWQRDTLSERRVSAPLPTFVPGSPTCRARPKAGMFAASTEANLIGYNTAVDLGA